MVKISKDNKISKAKIVIASYITLDPSPSSLLTWCTGAGAIHRRTLRSVLTGTARGAVYSMCSFWAGDRTVGTLRISKQGKDGFKDVKHPFKG